MKKKFSDYVIDVFIYGVLIFVCVICLYPYLNQIAISLNEGVDSAKGGITLFPRKFTFENFTTIEFIFHLNLKRNVEVAACVAC